MTSELQEIARTRQEAGEIRLPMDIEHIRFYSWAVWGLGVLMAAVIWFVFHTNSRLESIEKLQGERTVKVEKFETYITSSDKAVTLAAGALEVTRDRIHNLEDWRNLIDPRITEMWFMKQHGISNRDDFFIRNKVQAPAGPADNIRNP